MILFARILSFLFHPIIFLLPMPFFVVYRQTASGLYALKWEIFSLAFILLGITLLVLARIKGLFSDYDLSKREERYVFYKMMLFLAFLYLATAVFLKGIFSPLSIIAFGIILGLVVFEVINGFMKASIHVGVACAFVVALSLLYGKSGFLATFWMIPLVFWSRIALQKHTLNEVIVGGFFGATITLVTFLVGTYLYGY